MPVQLRSITGKVDYDVEQTLRDLTSAVNALEGTQSPQVIQDLAQRIAAVRQAVQQATQRIDDLNRRVTALENP